MTTGQRTTDPKGRTMPRPTAVPTEHTEADATAPAEPKVRKTPAERAVAELARGEASLVTVTAKRDAARADLERLEAEVAERARLVAYLKTNPLLPAVEVEGQTSLEDDEALELLEGKASDDHDARAAVGE